MEDKLKKAKELYLKYCPVPNLLRQLKIIE